MGARAEMTRSQSLAWFSPEMGEQEERDRGVALWPQDGRHLGSPLERKESGHTWFVQSVKFKTTTYLSRVKVSGQDSISLWESPALVSVALALNPKRLGYISRAGNCKAELHTVHF